MSFNITPVASGYQEIHPYSAINIDSVEINTSLIMMREAVSLSMTFYSLYHCIMYVQSIVRIVAEAECNVIHQCKSAKWVRSVSIRL